ncbi:hypothetical protein N9L68_04590 [bacterium]|nr:hypothetical protein [bacterium]
MIITNHAEGHTSLHMPINLVRVDALAAHISDHVSTWAGKMEIPIAQALQMFVAPLDRLGLHLHGNWQQLSADISRLIAADPINAAAFVISPLVGKITDQYCYDKIRGLIVKSKDGSMRPIWSWTPGGSLFLSMRNQWINVLITVAISRLGWSSVPKRMTKAITSAAGPRAIGTNVRSL